MIKKKILYKNVFKFAVLFFSKTILASLICVIFVFLFFNYYIDYEVTPIKNNIIDGNDFFIKEYIREIAKNVSEETFVWGEFDCSQFSMKLVDDLRKNNLSAYCVMGRVKDEGKYYGHIWVSIIINNKTYNIEATSGDFIEEDVYNENYCEIKRGICI